MKPKDVIPAIVDMLPREPRSYNVEDDPGFWSNGEEILCPTHIECDIIATFLSDVFAEYPERPIIQTGYYDPAEDARNGETDKYSGFHYIRFEQKGYNMEQKFKVQTPIGYLMVEAKGAKDEYPGVFISFSEDGNEYDLSQMIACVEYDTGSEEIKTECYRKDYDEPNNIIRYEDGIDLM